MNSKKTRLLLLPALALLAALPYGCKKADAGAAAGGTVKPPETRSATLSGANGAPAAPAPQAAQPALPPKGPDGGPP